MQNARHTPLAEYRCTCGRLLFKGVLLSSSIEIKCKRCSKIMLFGNNTASTGSIEDASLEFFSVLVDEDENIVEVSDNYKKENSSFQEEVLGMHISSIDEIETANATRTFYRKHIKNLSTPNKHRLHIYEIRKPISLVLRDAPARNELNIYSQTAEVDRNGKYTYVSIELCELFGVTSNELLGKSIFDSFFPPDGALYAQWYSELLPAHCSYSLDPVRISANKEHTKKVIFIPLYSDMALLRGYTVLFGRVST